MTGTGISVSSNRSFALNGIEVGAKYRMGRGGLLDARLIYSRYGWIIDQARFNGLNRTTFGATYLNGFDLAFSYRLKSVARARDSEINPPRRPPDRLSIRPILQLLPPGF